MDETLFKCPHCGDEPENIDQGLERIQNSDDLNGDAKSTITMRVELWYCVWCGNYCRAYYNLVKLTKLSEGI